MIRAPKSLKNWNLIDPFCAKYTTFDLKKYRGIYFMIPKSGAKFEEKLIFCFKNAKNLVSFDPSTKKSKTFQF